MAGSAQLESGFIVANLSVGNLRQAKYVPTKKTPNRGIFNDQRRTRQVQVNELAPGAQASVAAGWRFAESDLVTDVLVRVVSATPP